MVGEVGATMSERYEIKSVGVASVFKVALLIGIILGLILGVIYAVVFGTTVRMLPIPGMPTRYPGIRGGVVAAMMVVMGLLMGLIGGVVSAIILAIEAAIYNFIAGRIGGVEVELAKAVAAVRYVEAEKPVTAAVTCPTCGRPARYIKEYQRWWCDYCRKYL
ncbi:MAG: hypothetical protein DRN99_01060 [Thermoproteota archaeon]|nr:MAG: hypothetical protein DRN99_01060 [Candidatus Korarchaeota archaeon]